jgi:hypothetical protein
VADSDSQIKRDQPSDEASADAERRNPFVPLADADERTLQRLAVKRAALWGLGLGLSMAIVMVLCVLLLYWANVG